MTARPPTPPIPLAPLLLWTAVQLAAVALAAGRVPLSANYPQPAERAGLGLLAVAQIAAAGLLFPVLLPTLRAAAATAAVGVGYLALAGLLAEAPPGRVLAVGGYLTLWLLTLYLLNRRPTKASTRPLALALVNLLTLGPPLLAYLRLDLTPTAGLRPFGDGLNFLPLPATAALSATNSAGFLPWLGIFFWLLLAVFAAISPRFPRLRQLIHK